MSPTYRKCSHHEEDGSKSKQTFPTSELWVIKRHHAGTKDLGEMTIYCHYHLMNRGSEGSSERSSGRIGAVCPNDNLTVPLTGICDECGCSAK